MLLWPSFQHNVDHDPDSWRPAFSYFYTEEIQFSPLRSEKASSKLPLSCSPKSMYSLARTVRNSLLSPYHPLIVGRYHWRG